MNLRVGTLPSVGPAHVPPKAKTYKKMVVAPGTFWETVFRVGFLPEPGHTFHSRRQWGLGPRRNEDNFRSACGNKRDRGSLIEGHHGSSWIVCRHSWYVSLIREFACAEAPSKYSAAGIYQPSIPQESRLREGERGFLGSRFWAEWIASEVQQMARMERSILLQKRPWGRRQETFGRLVRGSLLSQEDGNEPLMDQRAVCASCQLWKLPEYFYVEMLEGRGLGRRMTERGRETGGLLVKYSAATGENKGLRQEIEALEKKHGEGQGKSWGFVFAVAGENTGLRQEIKALEKKHSEGPGKSWGFIVGGRSKGDIIGREKWKHWRQSTRPQWVKTQG
ncbi:hypothetical protein BS47DRAFT_1358067 [Hydnum rufescens UP504]|uniref:Uncharacterized protein n=1 Tax=Hydnum rufescens UP504 TaxID=1448309 RepID=A0A9P6B8L4_9AGAM|nr:hypothetical protein BS47DRAFT_1358067 [Hydnum rufescens UP504]